jgi:hypothetical protein
LADEFVVLVSGQDGLASWRDLDKKAARNMSRAVNAAAARAKAESSREISAQVGFPSNYLTGDRFSITKYSTDADPESIITARFRPTSLARFVTSMSSARGRGRGATAPVGLAVEVKPGLAKFMTGAFTIPLRRGTADIDTQSNMGVAIRLRGTPMHNKRVMAVSLAKGLYLLYGPSVAQVFGGDDGVAEKVSGPTAEYMASEFERLMGLDL